MTPKLSIIAPVFNESGNLKRLASETGAAMARAGLDHELILVDDGSTDGSTEEMAALAVADARIRALALDRHRGQSAALLAGIRTALAPLVVTMDADLQNDPADIPAIAELLEDHAVVSGVRTRRQDTVLRRLASRVANLVRRTVLRDPCTDIGCALKGYRATVLRDLPAFNGLHRFLPVMALRHGGSYVELPVAHRPRTRGVSKYNLRGRLLRGIVDVFGVCWYRRRAVSADVRRLDGP